jgi:hypothetical protein
MTWLAPADFAPDVVQYCVPVVRAMKDYERLHGQRPESLAQLGPQFAAAHASDPGEHELKFGEYNFYYQTDDARYYEYIHYQFTPGNEGWSVVGKLTEGPIPVPPVTADP